MGKILKLVTTDGNLKAAEVLAYACMTDLKDVVVMGWTEGGQHYFSSTYPDGPNVLWLLEVTKKELLETEAMGNSMKG